MHDIRRLGLQVFAAPNNLTGEVQIEVKAREIDFVTSFGKNLKALLDILGITRMIRKENNSVLKTKTVKGELQSGDVGEGEEIPMSRYTVEEKPFDTIKIEKYRKGVSLEAISEKGYEAAVQDTDDEFKSDLQNVVTDKFYAQLKAGSLTGHETTWQMAVAMAIGKVVAKFQKMKRTATGVAVWVNTLDVYKYLGAADITLQTAFGFKYLTNFLGADVVFVTSEVPQNVVIATPLNNMIAYYVDPGDSEFAKAGLSFTTDSETGFIGFHTEGTYSRTDQQAGRVLKTYTYMTSHLRKQNPWYWNWGHCDLRKEGSKLTFFYNGSYPSFNIPEIADMKCAKIQIAIKQRGTRSGNKYLTYNGINAFYFQKLHVEKWRDVPNKFAQDCSLIANCSDGSIRMNGLPKPDLGALGNDWETFCLKPGVNQVQCLCSSWAKKPTFKMKYREVFL